MHHALRVLVVILLAAAPAWAGVEVLHLSGDRQVQGPVLKENADTVFVDLGYTVLAVPKTEIVRRAPLADAATASDAASSRQVEGSLYWTASDLEERSVRDNVTRVADAVVRISTPNKGGSGFFITPDGYLVTNEHVVAGETEITVTVFETRPGTIEKRKIENVKVVALNSYVDLALLKVDGETELPYVHLGDVGALEVGQVAFAIGNPLGLERTVSEGILSSLNRPFEGLTYLQTTVQINPGNSGGPLFNLSGEVIGVTNMQVVFAEGLNFAIPVDRLKDFLANRDAFAFDRDNPNTGYRYLEPPRKERPKDGAPRAAGS